MLERRVAGFESGIENSERPHVIVETSLRCSTA
jgi:hypothetical protein